MTFTKEQFAFCVQEANRCVLREIDRESDRAILWASERIKELEKQLAKKATTK